MQHDRKNTNPDSSPDKGSQAGEEAGANLPDHGHEIADAERPLPANDCHANGGNESGARDNQMPPGSDKDIPAIGNLPDPEHEIDDAQHDDMQSNEGDSGWFPATRN